MPSPLIPRNQDKDNIPASRGLITECTFVSYSKPFSRPKFYLPLCFNTLFVNLLEPA